MQRVQGLDRNTSKSIASVKYVPSGRYGRCIPLRAGSDPAGEEYWKRRKGKQENGKATKKKKSRRKRNKEGRLSKGRKRDLLLGIGIRQGGDGLHRGAEEKEAAAAPEETLVSRKQITAELEASARPRERNVACTRPHEYRHTISAV
jgi:hypothetical protein